MSTRILAVLFLSLAACGPLSRATARDDAARHACDHFKKCNEIGSGRTYSSEDDCRVRTQSYFNDAWADAKCATIQSKNLSVCTQAIDITTCDNVVDFFNTLGKCSDDMVCAP